MYIHIYKHMHTNATIYIHICVYTHRERRYKCECLSMSMYAYTYTLTRIYIYMYAYMWLPILGLELKLCPIVLGWELYGTSTSYHALITARLVRVVAVQRPVSALDSVHLTRRRRQQRTCRARDGHAGAMGSRSNMLEA